VTAFFERIAEHSAICDKARGADIVDSLTRTLVASPELDPAGKLLRDEPKVRDLIAGALACAPYLAAIAQRDPALLADCLTRDPDVHLEQAIAELAAVGVGAILVPFPHAVDDHQTHNAAWLVRAGAAELHQQDAIDAAILADRLQVLLADRAALLEMARRARATARPDATSELKRACLVAAGAAS